MKTIILNLQDKNYVRAFGLMTPEEQECYKKVGRSNCDCIVNGKWDTRTGSGNEFDPDYTYAIKPDYKPEPEFVDLEVKENDGWLGCEKTKDMPIYYVEADFIHLHCLPSLPNFEGFLIKQEGMENEKWFLQGIAKQMSEGKKVYARFKQ